MESSIYPVFKDWSVSSIIGRGGFGEVYLVERKTEGSWEKAALKVTRFDKQHYGFTESPDTTIEKETGIKMQSFIQKMTAKVQLITQLSNDCVNIIRYRDFLIQRNIDDPNVKFMILMDLLTPLRKHFSDGIIEEKQIIQLGIDICNALIYLERNSIIHGDIKPENIFIDDYGNYVLGDFGSVFLEYENNATHIGTLNYIAPEVYVGGTYTHSVDIYGIGMVLFRFLNGGLLPFLDDRKPLTPAAVREALEHRLSGEIPELKIKNKYLSECVIKAIHPSIKERYCSAEDLKKDLELAYSFSKDVQYIQKNRKQTSLSEEYSKTGNAFPSTSDFPVFPKHSESGNVSPQVFSFGDYTEATYQLDITSPVPNETKGVHLNLIGRDPANEISNLSDSELAYFLDKSVAILRKRAEDGNPIAKSHLYFFYQNIKSHLPSPTDEYARMIFKACCFLVENSSYSSSTSENEMNDYIRDILKAQGNIVQDQTRQGRSSSRKSAGNLDIKATYGNYEPVIIEALKLNALNCSVLSDHIERLMVNYDPIGVYCHFLLVYYYGKSFNEFAYNIKTWLESYGTSQIAIDGIESKRHYTNLTEIRAVCTRDTCKEQLIVFIMNINK